MVTLTVAGVLLAVGVPGFFQTIRSNRAATNANDLVAALTIARSEAVRRGANIGVCESADGASCGTSTDWASGWIVFVDSAAADTAAPVIAHAGDILRVWSAPSGGGTVGAGTYWVRFLPRGDVRAATTTPVTFSMRLPGCTGQEGRDVELNAVGRTSVERVACP